VALFAAFPLLWLGLLVAAAAVYAFRRRGNGAH
jgi:hypothetical protein